MSAGNSYFKEEVIERIMKFAASKFTKVIVLAPDEPAEHTYKALGYEKNKSKRKAKLNANLLQNRARRIKEKLIKEGIGKNIEIIEWVDDIITNEYYKKSYQNILKLYKNNRQFRDDAKETTKLVLTSKFNNISENTVDEAVFYLLKELAFIFASLEIYHAEEATYIYHKEWPIYQKFISGVYDSKIRTNFKFLLY